MPTPLYTKCKTAVFSHATAVTSLRTTRTQGTVKRRYRVHTEPSLASNLCVTLPRATAFPPDQGPVARSVAAGGRHAAVARGGDGLIRARHRQRPLRLDERQFGHLALDPQTLRQPMQTPDVVPVTFRPHQDPIEAQVGAIDLFRFVHIPLREEQCA